MNGTSTAYRCITCGDPMSQDELSFWYEHDGNRVIIACEGHEARDDVAAALTKLGVTDMGYPDWGFTSSADSLEGHHVILQEDPSMSSKTPQELYELANQNGVIIKDLKANGRTWEGQILDGLHPDRPTTYFIRQADEFKRGLGRFAEVERETYLKDLAARVPTPDLAPVAPILIELPADDEQAYEQGYNAGLTDGVRLGTRSGPTTDSDSISFLQGQVAALESMNKQFSEQVNESEAVIAALRDQYRDEVGRLQTIIELQLAALESLDDEIDNAEAILGNIRDYRCTATDCSEDDDETEHDQQLENAARRIDETIDAARTRHRAMVALTTPQVAP